ncbi:MAG: putative repeat protein (TIGR01451 family) [Rhodothermales bacterium]|jgi:uncharacterized repeat protein (TIGR01451 family)
MYPSTPIGSRSRASIADFTAWILFVLLLLAVALPASAQTYSSPTVDLELTKSVNTEYAAVGEDVVYTIRVSNQTFYGSSAKATNIVVKDYLPYGLTALQYSATTGGEHGITFDHSTLTWNIEWLNAGQSVDLQFKARVNQVGEFKNCAEIWDADQKDVDSKTGAEAYGPLAGLYQGEDDEDCAEFWGVNSGSISGMVFDDLDGNGLFDNYEAGLTGFEIDLNTIGNDHTCGTYDDVEVAFTDSDYQGNYTFWDVIPGTYCVEIDDITIPHGFQRTTGNPVKVTVGAGEDVTGVKFGFLKPRVDLELTKVVDNENPTVGDTVTFTLTLTNNNVDHYGQIVPTATATGIQVKDYLPQGFWLVEGSTGYGVSFNESQTTWSIDQLEAGKSVSLVLKARVENDGELTNCTEVWDAYQKDRDSKTGAEAYGELVGGADAEDDQDCASLWAQQSTIDLELTKVVDNAYPTVGDKVTFTLTLTNNDHYATVPTATATGIQVKDYLPQGLTFHDASAGYGITFDEYATTWHIDQLEAGKSVSLVLTATVSTDGEFANCTEVWDANQTDRDSKTGEEAYGELVGGPNAEDDQDCASLWASPRTIDLELTKQIDNPYPSVGDKVNFTLTLTNNDAYGTAVTSTATGVQVKDYLPAGLGLHKANAPAGTSFDTGSNTWKIDQLGAGKSLALVLEVVVNTDGEFTNCAEVWDANEIDRDSKTGAEAYGELVGGPNAEDDQDCASLWVAEELIDLEVTKSVDDANPSVGDTINFTITVTNNDVEGYQQVPTAKATNVFVKDYVPAGLWVIEGSSSYAGSNGVTFDTNSNTWKIEWIAAGQSVTLTLKARVDEKGEFENCAEVWDADQKDRDSQTGDEAGSPLAGSYEDDQDCVSYWVGDVANPPAGKGSVTGVVFHDLNYNGVLDYGETGLTGFEVDLTNLGSDYVCGGYDDVELATNDTDAYGAYSFWDVDAGTYCVRILDVAIPYGYTRTSPDPVKVVVTAYDNVVVNFGFKASYSTPPPPPPSGDALCYMVADNDGNGYGSADVLTSLNEGAYQDVIIGGTQTEQIEAIAFNPWNKKLYAADANRLGTLDLYTGKFHEVGEFGGGEGAEGWLAFLDVDGLSFDPYSDILFGSVRRTGERDLLIQIDAASGKAIKGAFGYGVDYLVIQPESGYYYGQELNDIDDLAMDPDTRKLYAINNLDGEHSRLVIIDPATGWITKVLELPVENVEGLAFFNNGTLYGTAGEGDEAIIEINKHSLQVTVHASIGVDGNRDYEAIDCLTAAPSYLSVAVFGDMNGDGVMQGFEPANAGTQVDLYRDMDEDGAVSENDMLVATTTADQTGQAMFAVAATGAFVIEVDNGGSPIMLPAAVNGFGMSVETSASASMSTSTSSESQGDLPAGFGLSGNYPNPFNPQTTVRFETPESGRVRLSVHDVLGREIAVLVDGVIGAGSHDATFDAADLPSGTYMARLSGSMGVQSRTMVLLK